MNEQKKQTMIAMVGLSVGEAIGTMVDSVELTPVQAAAGVLFIAGGLMGMTEYARKVTTSEELQDLIDVAARAFVHTGSADQAVDAAREAMS